MDPLRALKLVGRNQPFDEAAVRQGLERKGAYQLDAFPQFNEAMAEVQQGGPIADAMFADMLRYYTEGNTPAPVPVSRKPVISEEVIFDRTFAPQRIKADRPKGTVAAPKKKAQEFKDNYLENLTTQLDVEKPDDIDDLIMLAALGSILGGSGINEATKEEPSEFQPS